jgi:protein-tyrosine phosphatase
MASRKTSVTDPLRINSVTAPGGGLVGMTFCPGKKQANGINGNWDRDLAADLDHIRDWGAVAVVTLMEQHELDRYKVANIGAGVRHRGMVWLHLPIVDAGVPRDHFERDWKAAGGALRALLTEGRNILLHCRGGLGRTGMIAARLLVELGVPADSAISRVREARLGAIETPAQAEHVRQLPGSGVTAPRAAH